jgi:hypothetical protein
MRVRILVATALSEAQTLFRAQQGIVEECDAEARKLGVELAQMEREKGQFDISLQFQSRSRHLRKGNPIWTFRDLALSHLCMAVFGTAMASANGLRIHLTQTPNSGPRS